MVDSPRVVNTPRVVGFRSDPDRKSSVGKNDYIVRHCIRHSILLVVNRIPNA